MISGWPGAGPDDEGAALEDACSPDDTLAEEDVGNAVEDAPATEDGTPTLLLAGTLVEAVDDDALEPATDVPAEDARELVALCGALAVMLLPLPTDPPPDDDALESASPEGWPVQSTRQKVARRNSGRMGERMGTDYPVPPVKSSSRPPMPRCCHTALPAASSTPQAAGGSSPPAP